MTIFKKLLKLVRGQWRNPVSIPEKESTGKKEVEPPWIKYPGFPPGDIFWRQSGEAWFAYAWEPYWKSLTLPEQAGYLKKWNVPEIWWEFYFDPEYQAWLESTDD